MYYDMPPRRRGCVTAIVAIVSIVILVLNYSPEARKALEEKARTTIKTTSSNLPAGAQPIRAQFEPRKTGAAPTAVPAQVQTLIQVQPGQCVDIVDSIGDGVPTSGKSFRNRERKPFGNRMVIAAGFKEADHSAGVDLEGAFMSQVKLPVAMYYLGSGSYSDYPYDPDWYFGGYQRWLWDNPDPNQPDIIFYFGHLDPGSMPSFEKNQMYPAGTVFGYLSDGGNRALTSTMEVDGKWIYIHTHVQLTMGKELKDLVWWWNTYCTG